MSVSSTFQGVGDSRAESKGGSLALVVIAFVSLLTPGYFVLGTLVLDPGRIFFLFMTPWLLARWASDQMHGKLLVDYLVLLFVLWQSLSLIINNSLEIAFVYNIMNFNYVVGGYFLMRYCIDSVDKFFGLVRILRNFVLILLPFAIYESLTTQFVIPKIVGMIPGVTPISDVEYCCRFGLDRAQVVFSHPIHFGLFCSFMIGAYFVAFANYLSFSYRVLVGALMFTACFLSVSSGPVVSVLAQGAVIGYWLVTRNVDRPWRRAFIVAGVLYVILEIVSTRPAIYAIAERLAFNSATALVRKILFEYGVAQFWRTPILGIGHNRIPMPVWMTGSVDNYWLLVAVAYGFPAFAAFVGIFFLIYRQVGRNISETKSDWYHVNLAIAVMLTGLVMVLATVAVWLNVLGMIFMILGSSVFIFYAKPETGEAVATPRIVRRAVFGDDRADAKGAVVGAARSGEGSRPEPPKPKRRTVL